MGKKIGKTSENSNNPLLVFLPGPPSHSRLLPSSGPLRPSWLGVKDGLIPTFPQASQQRWQSFTALSLSLSHYLTTYYHSPSISSFIVECLVVVVVVVVVVVGDRLERPESRDWYCKCRIAL